VRCEEEDDAQISASRDQRFSDSQNPHHGKKGVRSVQLCDLKYGSCVKDAEESAKCTIFETCGKI
jgi:hypothetical protein